LQCVAVCCCVLLCVAVSHPRHVHWCDTWTIIHAVCCRVLQCAAVCCRALQRVAVSPNIFMDMTLGQSCVRRPTATYYYTLPTQCNSLQHTATHCNTLQRMCRETHSNILVHTPDTLQLTETHGNIMQHTATHVSGDSLQHTATHCNILQLSVTHGNTLQHTATTHCNTCVGRLTATHCNTFSLHCNSS